MPETQMPETEMRTTDRRTDRRTWWFQYTPLTSLRGGIKKGDLFVFKISSFQGNEPWCVIESWALRSTNSWFMSFIWWVCPSNCRRRSRLRSICKYKHTTSDVSGPQTAAASHGYDPSDRNCKEDLKKIQLDRGCPNGTNTPRGDNFSRHILDSWGVCMWSFMMIGLKRK